LAPTIPISGTVRFPDGRPAAFVEMKFRGEGLTPRPKTPRPVIPGRMLVSDDEDSKPPRDTSRMGGWTDKNGRYTFSLFGDMQYDVGTQPFKIDGQTWITEQNRISLQNQERSSRTLTSY
jgi:hypothetical protein